MPENQTIEVQGHGEVEATPDIAVIGLGVMSREREARAAAQAAATAMQAIIAAVQKQGIPTQSIQTTQLQLYLDPQDKVYVANHHLTVRTEDVANAGAILAAAVDAGANVTSGIQFDLADRTAPENQALELAAADARRKAEIVATALGLAIDRVDRVTVGGQPGGNVEFAPRRRPSSPAIPLAVGLLSITAIVHIIYRLRSRD